MFQKDYRVNILADLPIPSVYLSCHQDVEEATALIDNFGAQASREADRRAAHSRSVGNVSHYCRWRQISRLVELLTGCDAAETLH